MGTERLLVDAEREAAERLRLNPTDHLPYTVRLLIERLRAELTGRSEAPETPPLDLEPIRLRAAMIYIGYQWPIRDDVMALIAEVKRLRAALQERPSPLMEAEARKWMQEASRLTCEVEQAYQQLACWWRDERRCPCGARAESPATHPHVLGCPTAHAIQAVEWRPSQEPRS